jgi:hypothetical protein
VSAVNWDRLVDGYAIAHEYLDVAERLSDVAVANAEWLAQPRLKLLAESRRVVRVLFIHEIGVCFSAEGVTTRTLRRARCTCLRGTAAKSTRKGPR